MMDEAYNGREVEIFTTDNGHYKGIIESLDSRKHEIVLSRVEDMKTGRITKKRQHFFREQITNIILPTSSEEDMAAPPPTVDDLQKEDLLLDASDEGPRLFQTQPADPSSHFTEYVPNVSNISLLDPPQMMLIEEMGVQFDDTISQIRCQKVVSFAVEGRQVKRKGDVALVVIGTRQVVYLFDVRTLGDDCFDNGLKEIIESSSILKVVYDIRMVSDCLHSLYDVHPRNIFDCQVADIFIYKRKYGSYPSDVGTLSECLQKYRNMPREQCTFERSKNKITTPTSKIWTQHPFPGDFLNLCYKNAMYIRELRLPMIEQLLGEFLTGVNVYLDCVRSLPDHGAKFYNVRKLPKAIESISAYKDKRHHHHSNNRKHHHHQSKRRQEDMNAVSEDELSDPVVDEEKGAWGRGTDFTEKYYERHGEVVECIDSGSQILDKSKPILRRRTSNTNTPPNPETQAHDEQFPQERNNEPKPGYADVFSSGTPPGRGILIGQGHGSPHVNPLRKPRIDASLFPTEVDSCDEEKPRDQYQISTSELDSDDSEDFFTSSVNDPPRKKTDLETKIGNEEEWHQLPPAPPKHTPPEHASVVGEGSSSPARSLHDGADGVIRSPKLKPSGRGQTLHVLAQQCKKTPPRYLSDGKSTTFEFPTDRELMEAPTVAPLVGNVPPPGASVNVTKIMRSFP